MASIDPNDVTPSKETLLLPKNEIAHKSKIDWKIKLYVIVTIVVVIFVHSYPPFKEKLEEFAKTLENIGWYGSICSAVFIGLLIPVALPFYLIESTLAFNLPSFWQPFLIGLAGKFIGCSICFVLARRFARKVIIDSFSSNKIYRGITVMLTREPWKFSFIFRIILLPYFLKNYGLALPAPVTYLIYIVPAVVTGAIITAIGVNVTQTMKNIYEYNENEKDTVGISSFNMILTVFAIGLMIYVGRYTYKVVKNIEVEEGNNNFIKLELYYLK